MKSLLQVLISEDLVEGFFLYEISSFQIFKSNPTFQRMLGYSEEETNCLTIFEIIAHDRDSIERNIEQINTNRRYLIRERQYRRKDGSTFDVDVTVSIIQYNGRKVGCVIVRDVTEKKQMQAKLFRDDRITTMGMLASGIAHEVSSPLAYVVANLSVLHEEWPAFTAKASPELAQKLNEARKMVDEAFVGAKQLRSIIRDLSVFSKDGSDSTSPIDVRRSLETAVKIVSSEFRYRAKLARELQDIPLVDGNEARLGQVFLNLILNAAQAIPQGYEERNEIRVVTKTNPIGQAVIEIHDTGCGIPENIQHRIFTPFFTTKPAEVGTGLGLWITENIVTSMGGTITVKSRPQVGTTFTITLPPSRKRRSQYIPQHDSQVLL